MQKQRLYHERLSKYTKAPSELPYCVLDFETNSEATKGHLTNIWCLVLYFPSTEEVKYYLEDAFTKKETLTELQDILNTHVAVIQNVAFDAWVCNQIGLSVPYYEDTMILSYCLNPSATHSLRGIGEAFGLDVVKSSHEDFSQYSPEMLEYCIQDCKSTWECFKHMMGIAKRLDPSLLDLYYYVELPFIQVILHINHNGVVVDRENWLTVIKEYEEVRDAILSEILTKHPLVPGKLVKTKRERPHEQVCTEDALELNKFVFSEILDGMYHYHKVVPFNPNSGDHVSWVLTKMYGWKPEEFSSKTGKPKVDSDVLGKLDYWLAKKLCEYSKVNKMCTTYGTTLLEQVGDDGRLRGNFNQCTTKTGRLSSSNPNLQNLPSKGELGDKIRKLFICPSDKKLIGIDLDAFQVRILSYYLHTCFDENEYPDSVALWNEFNNNPNADPHQTNADLMGIERSVAKNCLFGNLFGVGLNKFATMSGISLERASEVQELQNTQYPSLTLLKEAVWLYTEENGGVITDLYGRRGVYKDILGKVKSLKSAAQRQSFNFLIQSTEASIIKQWMILVLDAIRNIEGCQLLLTVHDEILLECYEDDVDLVGKLVQDAVQNSDFLPGLKITATPESGDNWYQVH